MDNNQDKLGNPNNRYQKWLASPEGQAYFEEFIRPIDEEVLMDILKKTNDASVTDCDLLDKQIIDDIANGRTVPRNEKFKNIIDTIIDAANKIAANRCEVGYKNAMCGICSKPTDTTFEHNIDGRIVYLCEHCSELEKKINNNPIKIQENG